jgi:hypothetical protein
VGKTSPLQADLMLIGRRLHPGVDSRMLINNYLSRGRGGNVSFTHLIGYEVVKALTSARSPACWASQTPR